MLIYQNYLYTKFSVRIYMIAPMNIYSVDHQLSSISNVYLILVIIQIVGSRQKSYSGIFERIFKKINYFKLQLINKWQMTVVCRPSKLITSASSFQRCVQNSNGRLTSWGLGRLGVFGKKAIANLSIFNSESFVMILVTCDESKGKKGILILEFHGHIRIYFERCRSYFLLPNFIETLN